MSDGEAVSSVVIPTHNCGYFVGEAVESVLRQSCPALEVIVVDDGSTDDTARILAGFGDVIRVIAHEGNLGLPSARNSGIREARGTLVGFLDADDVWMPTMIERQEEEFRQYPELGLCFTSLIDCDEKLGSRKKPRAYRTRRCEAVFEELYLTAFPIPPSTTFVRRSVFGVVGMFDESMLMKQDFECWLRICMTFPVSCIGEPLCLRRQQAGSLTLSSSVEARLGFERRAFELCGEAAERLGVALPMSVRERTVVSQRRRYREAMGFGDMTAARVYERALAQSGRWRGADQVAGLLIWLLRRLGGIGRRCGRLVRFLRMHSIGKKIA